MTGTDDMHLKDLVTAPAGSGKTVQLLRRYLHELRAGVLAERIVAITFTRDAAAELVDRLSHVLQVQVGLAEPDKDDPTLYLPYAPDAATSRTALTALPNAPVATVDSFVFRLVQEFLLHASVRLPSGATLGVDGPLTAATSAKETFEEAARAALEALDDTGKVNAHAQTLLAEVRLVDAISDIARLAGLEDARLVGNHDLLQAISGFPLTRDEKFTKAAATALDGHDAALQALGDWPGAPAPAPAGQLAVLAAPGRADAAFKDERHSAVRFAAQRLGVFGPERTIDPWKTWTADCGWTDPGALARADTVRVAAWALSRDARQRALQRLAADGALDHTELLRVATQLCRAAGAAAPDAPLAALRQRFLVLMVDEVQDTNPEQLQFYEAFRAMSSDIRVFFVGDLRQSIYRFRDGDPHGWQQIIDDTPADRRGELTINYRSTQRLVAFQKALFQGLLERKEDGVADTSSVQASKEKAEGLRHGEFEAEPIVVVDAGKDDDVAALAIAAFARRLGVHWQTLPDRLEEGRLGHGAPADDDAAVLVRSWAKAAWAAAELARHGIAARVTGDRSLLQHRMAVDLRLLLRALLDTSDEIAWMGALVHGGRLIPAFVVCNRILSRDPHGSPTAGVRKLSLERSIDRCRRVQHPSRFILLGAFLRLMRLLIDLTDQTCNFVQQRLVVLPDDISTVTK